MKGHFVDTIGEVVPDKHVVVLVMELVVGIE